MIALLILLSILHIVIAGQCGSGSTCPTGYNGIIALDDCRGYYYCVYDEPTATISCPTNTKFDPDLQVCVSASSFTCSCGGAPIPAPAPSPTACGSGCPAGYTGILPSTNCLGYYYCTFDKPSAVMNCPTGTLFDETNLICALQSSVTCACADGSSPPPPAPSPPSPTTCGSGCPTGYTGILPTSGCTGYYYCTYDQPSAVMNCPTGTLFDETNLICALQSSVTCACADGSSPPPPAPSPPSPTTCGSGCPTGYTGILPSSGCTGYYYCTYNQPSAVMNCPSGQLFDPNLLICNRAESVTCDCGSAPTPLTMTMTEPAVSRPPPTPTSLNTLSLVSTSNTVTSTPICSPCPTTTWALVGTADCSGFYICDEGVPTSLTSCPAGHLWDDREIACVEGASCACNTAYSVGLQSTDTTQTSTNNDNSWPWYPDWMNGSKCTSDGKQPNWMGDGYLHSSEEECCEANFWWTNDCISSPSSQTDTSSQVATVSLMNLATADLVTADGSNHWYPKWSSNTCVNDGGHGSVSEMYHYDSQAECCEERFWWIDTCESSGGTAPSPGPAPYYPKYSSTTCLNDGNDGSVAEVYHYTDLQTCCDQLFWWALETCTSGGSGSGGTAPSPGPDPYYPDWSGEQCLNDGKHFSVAAVYHYETQQECCELQFWWSDTCSGGSGGSGGGGGTNPFYPDWDAETCIQDGNHADVNPVYHFASKDACCSIQFWWNDSC